MKYIIFDIETDGIEATKIHVLSYYSKENGIKSIYTYEEMKELLKDPELWLIGHNIAQYDIPVLEKLLKIKITNPIWDTWLFSQYLYAERKDWKHGLESYGERLGVKKIPIDDWKNLSLDKYIERCERDVEINKKLFFWQKTVLNKIQGESFKRFIEYMSDKARHIKINSTSKINLDISKAYLYFNQLSYLYREKEIKLQRYMPEDVSKILKKKPNKLYKKDGNLTVEAEKWFKLLENLNLPKETTEVVYEKPNPGSVSQIKKWLFRLGWKPDFYKTNKDGKEIPQLSKNRKLTDSVLELAKKYPAVKELESYYKIRHRKGLVWDFISYEREGKLHMNIRGLTKTLRLAHGKPIVNMPKEEVIRSLLYAEEGYILIGADISGLEDRTKQHLIYDIDKEYVESMQSPDFDPHLDIAIRAGLMTEKDTEKYKELSKNENYNEEYHRLHKIRSKAKTVNFAATYGVGATKLSKTLNISIKEAKNILDAYWKRNWSVKKIAENAKIKAVYGKKYIQNPVSKIWIPITAEKDAFSAINQNLGVYVFDTWVKNIIKNYPNIKIWLQYHDEVNIICKKDKVEHIKKILQKSIDITNKELNLNVYIPIDIKIGTDYYKTH